MEKVKLAPGQTELAQLAEAIEREVGCVCCKKVKEATVLLVRAHLERERSKCDYQNKMVALFQD